MVFGSIFYEILWCARYSTPNTNETIFLCSTFSIITITLCLDSSWKLHYAQKNFQYESKYISHTHQSILLSRFELETIWNDFTLYKNDLIRWMCFISIFDMYFVSFSTVHLKCIILWLDKLLKNLFNHIIMFEPK